MYNIDGDLRNADWLKSAADIKASGGDIEELAKTDPDLPVVQRHKAKLSKNFTVGGGTAGSPLASGFVPFDLPGSRPSPGNDPHDDARKKTMRDFFQSDDEVQSEDDDQQE
jgi:hypothetical protein